MRFRPLLLSLGFLSLAIAGCGRPVRAPGGLSNQDQAALRSLAERDAPIVRARDWVTLAAEYTEDAVRMPPNGPAIEGRAAIRRWLDGLPPITAFDFRLVSLDGQGGLAFLRGAYSITVAPRGAPQLTDSGKILVVLRKQSDGSWLRVADAWNSDLPLPQ